VPLFDNKSTMIQEMDYYFSLSDLCQKPIRSSTCNYIEQIFIEISNLQMLLFFSNIVLYPGLLDNEAFIFVDPVNLS
jgi:hypothetical protein